MPEGGTYTLVFSLAEPLTLDVGALGECSFPVGGYSYTGSALGPGGFGRIDRHRRVAAGEHDVRHWHVDYFGGHPATALVAVERVNGRDCECVVAQELGGGPVQGFGSSDCDCGSHLARFPDAATARERVSEVYGRRW